MSVFTTITEQELIKFLTQYDIGQLVQFNGIDAGIENTNYFVTTQSNQTQQKFILTIFETIGFDDLPYVLNFMVHLANHNVPCARPVFDHKQQCLQTFKDKPAALIEFLSGTDTPTPTIDQCRQAGEMLALFHQAGQSFTQTRENPRGPEWWSSMKDHLSDKMNDADKILINDEITFQAQTNRKTLPNSVIHADLFRDNILFQDSKLSGIIDLYFACNDAMLYDLAVAVNDWCMQGNYQIEHNNAVALLDAYHKLRPLSDAEHRLWPTMLRAGALRFWLSRLNDLHFPRTGELTHIKNPDDFKNILLAHRANQKILMSIWV